MNQQQEIISIYRKLKRRKRFKLGVFLAAWVLFLLVACVVTARGQSSAMFGWLPNSESDLAGYKIYFGPATREYTDVVDCGLPEVVDGHVECAIGATPDVNTYFAATAYDTNGNESYYSNEVTYDPPPRPPEGFTSIKKTASFFIIPVPAK